MNKTTLALAASAFLLASCGEEEGPVFYFPRIESAAGQDSGGVVAERRALPKDPSRGELRLFVDELVLGPETPRLRPLFSLGTSVEFCFVAPRDGVDVLYVGLSEDAVQQRGSAAEIQRGIELFRENVTKNFANIGEVVLFIGGNVVNECQN